MKIFEKSEIDGKLKLINEIDQSFSDYQFEGLKQILWKVLILIENGKIKDFQWNDDLQKEITILFSHLVISENNVEDASKKRTIHIQLSELKLIIDSTHMKSNNIGYYLIIFTLCNFEDLLDYCGFPDFLRSIIIAYSSVSVPDTFDFCVF